MPGPSNAGESDKVRIYDSVPYVGWVEAHAWEIDLVEVCQEDCRVNGYWKRSFEAQNQSYETGKGAKSTGC